MAKSVLIADPASRKVAVWLPAPFNRRTWASEAGYFPSAPISIAHEEVNRANANFEKEVNGKNHQVASDRLIFFQKNLNPLTIAATHAIIECGKQLLLLCLIGYQLGVGMSTIRQLSNEPSLQST